MGANDSLCQLHVCVAMYGVYMYIIRNAVNTAALKSLSPAALPQ